MIAYAILMNVRSLVTIYDELFASVEHAPSKLLDRAGNDYSFKIYASAESAIVNDSNAVWNFDLVKKNTVAECALADLVNAIGNRDTVKLAAFAERPVTDVDYAVGNVVLNLSATCGICNDYGLILVKENVIGSVSLIRL